MRRITFTAWSAAAVSGVLQVLIFPSPALSWLSWVALAPLMAALLSTPQQQILTPGDDSQAGVTVVQGFWLGYLCGIIWYLGSCYWVFHVMYGYGGLSAPVAAGILILFAFYLGLYHGLFGALLVRISHRGRPGGLRALVVAPFLWVAVELARSRITGFPWDLLGTAQVDNLILSRLATITGVYGLSLLVALVNAFFAAAWVLRRSRTKWSLAAVTAAALLQSLALITLPPSQTTHGARLVQENLEITNAAWTSEYFDHTIAELADLSRQPKQKSGEETVSASPRLIIWPESPAPFYVNDPKFNTWMRTLATDQQSYVLSGSLGLKSPASGGDYDVYNSAVLVSPSGALVARYDKVHLVPFGEYVPLQSLLFFAKNLTKQVGTFSRGKERTVFKLHAGEAEAQAGEHHHPDMEMAQPEKDVSAAYKVGAFICYESVFPDEIRLFALSGAQVFVNISNDGWFGNSGAPGQHLNMARMRAIENHRWLLRATNTGITAGIDPYGRVVTRAERNTRVALNAPYAMIEDTTFYTRHGDWFAYACAIIALAAAIVRLRLQAGILR